jgi:hypothetical protein
MEVNFTPAFIIIIIAAPALAGGLYLFFKYFLKRSADVTEQKEREWEGYENYLTAEDIKKNLEWELEQMGVKKNGRK